MAIIEIKENVVVIDGFKIGKGSANTSMNITSSGVVIINGGVPINIEWQGTTINGVEVTSAEDLSDKLEVAFKNGSGSGGSGGVQSVTGTLVSGTAENPIINNPFLEVHRILVTDEGNRTITDFAGTLSIVANGLDVLNSFTLSWGELSDETAKLTLCFNVDCDIVNNVGLGETKVLNLPNRVKDGDVWTVVYDKFFDIWNLASVNSFNGGADDPIPKGTPADIMSFDEDGNLKAERINAWHLTDIGGKPSYEFGPFCGAGLQKEKPLLLFRKASEDPEAGIFPLYTTGGRLKVANAVNQDEAVNLSQITPTRQMGVKGKLRNDDFVDIEINPYTKASTIVMRTDYGHIHCADPVVDDQAATKRSSENLIKGTQTTVLGWTVKEYVDRIEYSRTIPYAVNFLESEQKAIDHNTGVASPEDIGILTSDEYYISVYNSKRDVSICVYQDASDTFVLGLYNNQLDGTVFVEGTVFVKMVRYK